MALARKNLAILDGPDVVDNATVEVRSEISGGLAVLYEDREGLTPLGNPFVCADGGNLFFHTVGGEYKIVATKDGFTREWRYEPVGTAAATDVGVAGGSTGVRLTFDDATTASDPGSGIFRANHATFASITALYVDNLDYGASSLTAWLDALDDGGTSAHRCILRIEGSVGPLQWAEFNVTGSVVDSTGYRTITVTPRAEAGWPFIDGLLYSVTDTRTGISGANGTNGASALTVVRVASRTNVTIASALEQGDTVDGVVLVAGDLVLLTGQTAPAENGVYVAVAMGAGAASRHASFDTYNENPGACFSVQEGTANANTIWQCTSAPGGTIGSTALTFVNRLQIMQAGMYGGSIVASRTGNAETYAVKTLAGNDPSAGDPVYFAFDDGSGSIVVRAVTAALSLTISSGSTMGFTNGVAGRLWLEAFDDSGTVRIGAINCRSGTNIFPLRRASPAASSTAEGGAGAADSAHVFYTATAVTSKPYIVIGYATYESGLATAGTWVTAPSRVQLMGSGVALPGDVIQLQGNTTGAYATGATNVPADDTIPQNTEGDQYMSQAITPTSAANLLQVESSWNGSASGAAYFTKGLFQDSVASALAVASVYQGSANTFVGLLLNYMMVAATTSATTFKIRVGASSGTTYFNGNAGARYFGGVWNSYLRVREIQA